MSTSRRWIELMNLSLFLLLGKWRFSMCILCVFMSSKETLRLEYCWRNEIGYQNYLLVCSEPKHLLSIKSVSFSCVEILDQNGKLRYFINVSKYRRFDFRAFLFKFADSGIINTSFEQSICHQQRNISWIIFNHLNVTVWIEKWAEISEHQDDLPTDKWPNTFCGWAHHCDDNGTGIKAYNKLRNEHQNVCRKRT